MSPSCPVEMAERKISLITHIFGRVQTYLEITQDTSVIHAHAGVNTVLLVREGVCGFLAMTITISTKTRSWIGFMCGFRFRCKSQASMNYNSTVCLSPKVTTCLNETPCCRKFNSHFQNLNKSTEIVVSTLFQPPSISSVNQFYDILPGICFYFQCLFVYFHAIFPNCDFQK